MQVIQLNSLADTWSLGEQLGTLLKPGDLLALCGSLGAGKTHLTKAVAASLGAYPEIVSSPTFALVHEYREGRIPIFHFDFYRMQSADEVLTLGWDEYLEAGGICVVEWADLFPQLLPAGTQWWRLELSLDGTRRAWREK